MDNIYITLAGKSAYAIVNSFWASLKIHEYEPDHVYIVTDEYTDNTDIIIEAIRGVLLAYGLDIDIDRVVIIPYDFQGCMNAIREILDLKSEDSIALDITSGRKYMATAALLAGWERYDHVFFLQTERSRFRELPFLMRPLMYQYPADLKEEVSE